MGLDKTKVGHGAFARLDVGADAALGDDRDAQIVSKHEPKDLATGGAVYFMTTVGAPFVKIGWVRDGGNVAKRRDIIQAGCPYDLIVSAVLIVERRTAETALHRRFAEYHFRGEWFLCEGALRRFVQLVAAFPEKSLCELLEKTS